MKRRGNGEGSISEYGNGWRGTIMNGRKDNGQPNRKQIYGKTRAAVVKKLNEYKSKNIIGSLQTNDKITLQQWFNTYIEEFRINDLRPSTIEKYTGIYNNYIKNSNIGMTKLKDLKGTHIQAYYNLLIKDKNKTPNTIKSLHKVLKTALKKAVKENYITTNYCNNVDLPKIPDKEEIEVFTLDEQQTFINFIGKHRLKALFLIALGTGLRVGEILSLKWANLDLINRTVTVNSSLKRVAIHNPKMGEPKTELIQQSPKTKYSKRTIPVPSNLIKELTLHQQRQNLEMKVAGAAYVDNGFVFATELGRNIDPRNLSRSYARVLANAGIPHKKFHSLRHTYATRLFERGIPLKTVSTLLGHATINITANTYTHVLENLKVDAVEKLNDLF